MNRQSSEHATPDTQPHTVILTGRAAIKAAATNDCLIVGTSISRRTRIIAFVLDKG
jgi:hypothetical protein